MRKMLLLLLFACFITSAVYAGGAEDQSKPEGPVTITMWNTAEALANPLTEMYIKDFEEKNPKVKVEFSIFPWTELRTKLISAFAAGEGPDQFQLDSPWLLEFEEAGLLDKAPESVVSDLNKNFLPIAKSLVSTEKATYGYPWWCFVDMLWLNGKLFDEANIDENQPIETWDKMLDVAKQLVVKDKDGNTLQAGLGFETRLLFFTDFLYNNRSSIMGEGSDGIPSKPIASTLNTKSAGEAFKFLYDAYNTNNSADNNLGWFGESFVQGKIAMVYGANWMYGWMKDVDPEAKIVIKPLPTKNAGDDPQMRCDGWIQVVSNKASAEAKEYSWKFLEEYVSTSGMDMTEYSFAIPTRLDVFEDPRFSQLDPVWREYASVLRDNPISRIKPVVKGWDDMNLQIDPLFQQLFAGEIGWQDMQNQSHSIVNRILQENY